MSLISSGNLLSLYRTLWKIQVWQILTLMKAEFSFRVLVLFFARLGHLNKAELFFAYYVKSKVPAVLSPVCYHMTSNLGKTPAGPCKWEETQTDTGIWAYTVLLFCTARTWSCQVVAVPQTLTDVNSLQCACTNIQHSHLFTISVTLFHKEMWDGNLKANTYWSYLHFYFVLVG